MLRSQPCRLAPPSTSSRASPRSSLRRPRSRRETQASERPSWRKARSSSRWPRGPARPRNARSRALHLVGAQSEPPSGQFVQCVFGDVLGRYSCASPVASRRASCLECLGSARAIALVDDVGVVPLVEHEQLTQRLTRGASSSSIPCSSNMRAVPVKPRRRGRIAMPESAPRAAHAHAFDLTGVRQAGEATSKACATCAPFPRARVGATSPRGTQVGP